MVLFDDASAQEAPRRTLPRSTVAGIWALTAALAVLLVITFLPTSYVIQRPGPVYDTLGSVTDADGEEVPLIAVDGARTYDTSGSLELLTVQVIGNPERTPSWFELATAWFDPTRAVLPIDAVFPPDQTTEQRDAESAQLMVNSQEDAKAAALTELGYDLDPSLAVASIMPESAADGVLEPGDVFVAADGQDVADPDALRRVINDGDGAPVELTIERAGREQTVQVTPREADIDGETAWVIGVNLGVDYEFPFDVTIQLDDVGGPSAGMMFALGIIDVLTPGDLTDGATIAGTGTIDAGGAVGPIGGVRQKMWGADGAGADYFLAPQANCDEVVGHVPSGLRVFAVERLDDALTVLDTIREDGDLAALPTCEN